MAREGQIPRLLIQGVQFSRSVVSDSLRPHESQHARPPCPSPSPGVHSVTSIESVMPSSHLILCRPLLLLPPIPPSIRVFSNESTLRMRWPKYWSLASFLPKNAQDWSPPAWTGWISLQSKGLSRDFSNATVQNSSSALSFNGPPLTPIHDYWKNHSFDYMDLCWQSNVSAFEYAV